MRQVRWFWVPLLLALAACVPERVVTQPDLRLLIQNEAGEAVPAMVTLYWWEYPHRRQRAMTTAVADAQGSVTFTETAETEVMVYVMPHGVPVYNWTFCVETDGYKTLIGTVSNVAPGEEVDIKLTLHPGVSLPVCADYERLPFHAGTPVDTVDATGGDVRGVYEVEEE